MGGDRIRREQIFASLKGGRGYTLRKPKTG